MSLDRHGRTVAMVTCESVLVNWRQVQDGLAWCFTKYLTQPATCLPLEDQLAMRGGVCSATTRLWRRGSFD